MIQATRRNSIHTAGIFGEWLLVRKHGLNSQRVPCKTADALVGAQIIGVFLTCNYSQEAQDIGRELVDWYRKVKDKHGHPFEIVVISCDINEQDYTETAQQMPWPLVPYQQSAGEKIEEKLGLHGAGEFALVSTEGKLLTSDGRSLLYLFL